MIPSIDTEVSNQSLKSIIERLNWFKVGKISTKFRPNKQSKSVYITINKWNENMDNVIKERLIKNESVKVMYDIPKYFICYLYYKDDKYKNWQRE